MSKRKPTHLRVVEGRPGAVEADTYEPKPAVVRRLVPTIRLSGEALAVWRREAPILQEAGIITQADVGILTQYCVAAGAWRKAAKKWREAGEPMLSARGSGAICEHPLLKLIRETGKDAMRIGEELGLTPASRAGLGVSIAEQVKVKSKHGDIESIYFPRG